MRFIGRTKRLFLVQLTHRATLSTSSTSGQQLLVQRHRKIFDIYAAKSNLGDLEGWYRVKVSEIQHHHVRATLQEFYGGNLVAALQTIYPEKQWVVWNFNRVPASVWHNKFTQRSFFDFVSEQLGVQAPEDWYQLSETAVVDGHKSMNSLLEVYDNSLVTALRNVYPEVSWRSWKFHHASRGYWADVDNQRDALDLLGTDLNISDPAHWLRFTTDEFVTLGLSGILSHYDGIVTKTITSIYPEYFLSRIPLSSVQRIPKRPHETERACFDRISNELGLKSLDDWYNVKESDLENQGVLLHRYDNSLAQALESVYPDYKWLSWRFSNMPKHNWKNSELRLQFMNWLAAQLGIQQLDDWHLITLTQLQHQHGADRCLAQMLQYVSDEPSWDGTGGTLLLSALQLVFPDHPWKPWRFTTLPKNYWHEVDHQRPLFDDIGKQLGLKDLDDWCGVSAVTVERLGGGPVLRRYGESMLKAFRAIYPQRKWHVWEFPPQQHLHQHQRYHQHQQPLHEEFFSDSFWDNISNQRQFMDWLAEKYEIRSGADWYNVRVSDVKNKRAREFLHLCYDDSLIMALLKMYPEYPWQVWKFEAVPSDFWSDEANVNSFLDWLSEELQPSSTSKDSEEAEANAWYYLTSSQLQDFRGSRVLQKFSGMQSLLTHLFPNQKWDMKRLLAKDFNVSKAQLFLLHTVRKLFPQHEVFLNWRHSVTSREEPIQEDANNAQSHEDVFPESPESSHKMEGNNVDPRLPHYFKTVELDIYVPGLQLALEYQGPHHYNWTSKFGSPSQHQLSDRKKKQLCKKLGISLVEIPYGWDGSRETLLGTLSQKRPDLIAVADASSFQVPSASSNLPQIRSRPAKSDELIVNR